MDYRASFTIPASTPAAAPITQEIDLGLGTIQSVRIRIPWGHGALAGIRFHRYQSQIYPTTPGAFYFGNDEVITIVDPYTLAEEPVKLTMYGYNEDDTFPHTFEVEVTVSPQAGAPASISLLRQVLGKLGVGGD